jgi:hypothetical protein
VVVPISYSIGARGTKGGIQSGANVGRDRVRQIQRKEETEKGGGGERQRQRKSERMKDIVRKRQRHGKTEEEKTRSIERQKYRTADAR